MEENKLYDKQKGAGVEKIVSLAKNSFVSWFLAVIFALGTFYGLTNNRLCNTEQNILDNKCEIKQAKEEIKVLREEQYKILMEINGRLARMEGKLGR